MSLPLVLMRGLHTLFQKKTRHCCELVSIHSERSDNADAIRSSRFGKDHQGFMFGCYEHNGTRLTGYAIVVCLLSAGSLCAESPQNQPDNALQKRLQDDVTWLAAPE